MGITLSEQQLAAVMAAAAGTGRQRDLDTKMAALGRKNTPTTLGGNYGPYSHGNGGLFSTPGVDENIFSATIMPRPNLANTIPRKPMGESAPGSDYGGAEVPLVEIITGVTKGDMESLSNQRDGPCDDPPLGGLMKAAIRTVPYGFFSGRLRVRMQDLGWVTNRGEPTDLRVLNPNTGEGSFVPSMLGGGSAGGAVRTELDKKFFEAATSFARYIDGRTYVGTPSNNNTDADGAIGYAEYPGVDLQVNTGFVDFQGQAAPRLDSYIEDFGFSLVSAASSGTSQIVRRIESLVQRLEYRGKHMGLEPLNLQLAMTEHAFDEIAKVWPVDYYHEALTRMAAFSNGRVMLSGRETTEMRDMMIREQVLPIRGKLYPVIVDNTIAELDGSNENLADGQYASDIYFLTFQVMGNIDVMFWEAFDQNNAQMRRLEMLLNGQTFTSDAGLFRWYVNHKNGCADFVWEGRWRLVNQTPFLCARLQNVAYSPIWHVDSWDPDSDYFLDGGVTNRAQDSFYTDWSKTTPVVISGRDASAP